MASRQIHQNPSQEGGRRLIFFWHAVWIGDWQGSRLPDQLPVIAPEKEAFVGKEQGRIHEYLKDKVVLLTGGTGSFGRHFTKVLTERFAFKALRIFSRDELKQYEMRRRFGDDRIRYLIGDVRDPSRLDRAMQGVDVVIHAAAMKQVPACEYNPFEAVRTNVLGAQNVVDAAINHQVHRGIGISSDKAVSPANLYGATKLCAEKIFVQGNAYAAKRSTRFSCVRYGNVLGSRGSVVPVFLEQRRTGRITVTDPRMTRYWLTLEQAIQFVLRCLAGAKGGEVFIPRIPSMRIVDVVPVVAPGCEVDIVGIRPGEKLHETLITEDESRHTLEYEDMFRIMPEYNEWGAPEGNGNGNGNGHGGRPLPDGFKYSSETNTQWLTAEGLRSLLVVSGYGEQLEARDQEGRVEKRNGAARKHSLRPALAR
ncbi:MAG: UDP-N-acetylglucosamine 4,6-dehydratase (inverting) [Nitrospirota bacterium]|nr:UDP-N-acetylglucosamine 4,6-dehydratase (inverting) [Nitrospirota bacterium]